MFAASYNSRWNANRGGSAGHVLQDDRVGADACMIPDSDPAQYLGAGADGYVSSDNRRTGLGAASSNCHLLKGQTVGTYD